MEGGLCFFHANPDKASELGRIRGKSKGYFAAQSADPLPKLETAVAVRDAVAQLIADVYSGKLHPRVAASLAPLLNLHLRLIETSKLEQRVAELERKMSADAQSGLEAERDCGDPSVCSSRKQDLFSSGDPRSEGITSADGKLDPKP
ncbi:MAG: hypothetical protein WBW82_02925, partial [Candidatus Sulfotelmatobacter sp.]